MKGCKKCLSNAMDGTDDMLCNGSEEDRNVRSVCGCVWKMNALTVKMETVTLIGKGRWNLTSFCVINV